MHMPGYSVLFLLEILREIRCSLLRALFFYVVRALFFSYFFNCFYFFFFLLIYFFIYLIFFFFLIIFSVGSLLSLSLTHHVMLGDWIRFAFDNHATCAAD